MAIPQTWLAMQIPATEHCCKRRKVYGKDRGRVGIGVTCGWKMAAWSKSYNGHRYERRYPHTLLAVVAARFWPRSSGAQKRVAALRGAGPASSKLNRFVGRCRCKTGCSEPVDRIC